MKNRINKVYIKFKDNLNYTLLISAILSLIIIIIYGISMWILSLFDFSSLNIILQIIVLFIFSLIIGLITPFIFCFCKANNIPAEQQTIKNYFINLPRLTDNRISKCFRVFTNMLISLLIFIILSFSINFVIYGIRMILDHNFITVVNEFTTIMQNNGDYLDYLTKNVEVFYKYTYISQYISSVIAFYYFLHNYAVNIFNFNFLEFSYRAPQTVYRQLFRKTIASHRLEFYKDFYSVNWIFIPIIIIVYSASYFLFYYFNVANSNIVFISFTSIVITLILVFPFLPLIFNNYNEIYQKYKEYYKDIGNKQIEEELNVLKEGIDTLSPEEQKQILEILNQREEIFKRFNNDATPEDLAKEFEKKIKDLEDEEKNDKDKKE